MTGFGGGEGGCAVGAMVCGVPASTVVVSVGISGSAGESTSGLDVDGSMYDSRASIP